MKLKVTSRTEVQENDEKRRNKNAKVQEKVGGKTMKREREKKKEVARW